MMLYLSPKPARMSRFWKDPQNIIAIGVTLISVCAPWWCR